MKSRSSSPRAGVHLRWFTNEPPPGTVGEGGLVWQLTQDNRRVVMEPVGPDEVNEPDMTADRSWVGREIFVSSGQASLAEAKAVIIVLIDPRPEFLDEFNDWYNTEHVPTLTKVPGIVQARRYRPDGNDPYLALYFMTSTDVLKSEAWLSAVKRTPWTERMVAKGLLNMEGLVPGVLTSPSTGDYSKWENA